MLRLIVCMIAAAAAPAVAAAQSSPPAAPVSIDQVDRWPRIDKWRTQRPGDARSPRFRATITLPTDRVTSLEGAWRLFASESRVEVVSPPRFERLEAWQKTNGTQMLMSLVETRLGGVPGVAFILVARQPRDNGQYLVWTFEMPRTVFVQWGGVARMMLLRGEIPSMSVFPAERQIQIASASLPKQVALYEAVLDRLYRGLATASMGSQGAVTQQMTQLNYNLLFGNNLLKRQ